MNEVVIVNEPMKSKITWTQVIGAIVMLASYFGLDISAELQAALLLVIGLVTQLGTYIFRVWMTGKLPTLSDLKAAIKAENPNMVVVPISAVKPAMLADVT